MSSEEKWTELLALTVFMAAPVYMAVGGFIFGPIFAPKEIETYQHVDLGQSLVGAGVGFLIGLVVAVTAYTLRSRAIKQEIAAGEYAHDAAETPETTPAH